MALQGNADGHDLIQKPVKAHVWLIFPEKHAFKQNTSLVVQDCILNWINFDFERLICQ